MASTPSRPPGDKAASVIMAAFFLRLSLALPPKPANASHRAGSAGVRAGQGGRGKLVAGDQAPDVIPSGRCTGQRLDHRSRLPATSKSLPSSASWLEAASTDPWISLQRRSFRRIADRTSSFSATGRADRPRVDDHGDGASCSRAPRSRWMRAGDHELEELEVAQRQGPVGELGGIEWQVWRQGIRHEVGAALYRPAKAACPERPLGEGASGTNAVMKSGWNDRCALRTSSAMMFGSGLLSSMSSRSNHLSPPLCTSRMKQTPSPSPRSPPNTRRQDGCRTATTGRRSTGRSRSGRASRRHRRRSACARQAYPTEMRSRIHRRATCSPPRRRAATDGCRRT